MEANSFVLVSGYFDIWNLFSLDAAFWCSWKLFFTGATYGCSFCRVVERFAPTTSDAVGGGEWLDGHWVREMSFAISPETPPLCLLGFVFVFFMMKRAA